MSIPEENYYCFYYLGGFFESETVATHESSSLLCDPLTDVDSDDLALTEQQRMHTIIT